MLEQSIARKKNCSATRTWIVYPRAFPHRVLSRAKIRPLDSRRAAKIYHHASRRFSLRVIRHLSTINVSYISSRRNERFEETPRVAGQHVDRNSFERVSRKLLAVQTSAKKITNTHTFLARSNISVPCNHPRVPVCITTYCRIRKIL